MLDFNEHKELLECPWNSEIWKRVFNSETVKRSEVLKKKMIALAACFTINFLSGVPTAHVNGSMNLPLAYLPVSRKLKGIPTLDWGKRPSSSGTKVHVVNIDSLDAVSSLHNANRGKKIICMIMGNTRHRCNGAWLGGAIAQEEMIFTRTNIDSSQDPSMYPIDDDEIIYTENATVMRYSIDDGFAFMEPYARFNADFVTVTAKNLSRAMDGYDSNVCTYMRDKIEAFFAHCAAKAPGSILVVGALGCGKFCNPPYCVAATYKELLTEYAGWFSDVYFAILDRGDLLIRAFAETLTDGIDTKGMEEAEHKYKLYPIWEGLLPLAHGGKESCRCGGQCNEIMDPEHTKVFWHPPRCKVYETCQDFSEMHLALHTHKILCEHFYDCTLYFKDKKHKSLYLHAPECPDRENCTDVSLEHARKFIHIPLCPNGIKCPGRNNPVHEKEFRHVARECEYGTYCKLFMDPEHIAEYSHPFLPPCPDTPFSCEHIKEEGHRNRYSHLCFAGAKCPKIRNPEHLKHYIHAAVLCSKGDKCEDMSEDHLCAYVHGSKRFRHPCKYTWCTDYSPEHRRKYVHYPLDPGLSRVIMINVHDPVQSDDYGNFTVGTEWHMDAEKNARKLIAMCGKYAPVNTDSKNFRDLMDWFRRMRPVHMCSVKSFLSMINLGGITSLYLIYNIWSDTEELMQTIMKHNRVRALRIPPDKFEISYKYAKIYTKIKRTEIKKKNWKSF